MREDLQKTTFTTEELAEELARLQARLDAAIFDRDLALERERRALGEGRRLELRLSDSQAEITALRSRVEERERYLGAIHSSLGWRLLQRFREFLGRRW